MLATSPAQGLGSSRTKQPLLPPFPPTQPPSTGRPREVPSTDQHDDAMSARTVSSRDHRSAHLSSRAGVVGAPQLNLFHATDSSWRFLHPSGDYAIKSGETIPPAVLMSPTTRNPHPPPPPPVVLSTQPSAKTAVNALVDEAEAALTSVLQQAQQASLATQPQGTKHAGIVTPPAKALSRLSTLSQLSYLHADGTKGRPSPHRGAASSLSHATQRLARSTVELTDELRRKPQQHRIAASSRSNPLSDSGLPTFETGAYPTLSVAHMFHEEATGAGNSPKGRLLRDRAHQQRQSHADVVLHQQQQQQPQFPITSGLAQLGQFFQVGSASSNLVGSQEFSDEFTNNANLPNPTARTPQPLELDQLLEALTRSSNNRPPTNALSIADSNGGGGGGGGSGVFLRDQTSPSFGTRLTRLQGPSANQHYNSNNGSTSPSTTKSLARRNSRNNMTNRSKALEIKSLQSHHKMYTLLQTATEDCLGDILESVPLLPAEDLPEEETLTMRMDLQRLYVTLHPFDHIVPATGVPSVLLHTIATSTDIPVELLVDDNVKYLTIQASSAQSSKFGGGGARHNAGARGSISTSTQGGPSQATRKQNGVVLEVSSVPKHLPLYIPSRHLDVVTHRMWHQIPGRVDPTKLVGSKQYDDRNRLLNILRAKQREAEAMLGIKTTYAKIAPPLLPDDEDIDYDDIPRQEAAAGAAAAVPQGPLVLPSKPSALTSKREGSPSHDTRRPLMKPLHEIRLDDLEDVAKNSDGKMMDVFDMIEHLQVRTKRRRSTLPLSSNMSIERSMRSTGRMQGAFSSDDDLV
ncbi:Hypothetical protein, putative [Bodo saltans]|uniref:Uncharacterized protein n=1 Tax=Bodo saltans TaxID=75058 RepID=A0A0S4JNK8_BODSA|nr:Hypothetical protein, putative [Bodo saltans]|eukprot:CUG93096.1 Hypothetical protein, putative [Bodo saltans]